MAAILGDWIHAHEQDSAGMKVYVPAGEALGPSRGRQRLSFLPDGTFVEWRPGSDDRPVQASGTYTFNGSKLVLEHADGSPPLVYEVLGASNRKSLLLRKT